MQHPLLSHYAGVESGMNGIRDILEIMDRYNQALSFVKAFSCVPMNWVMGKTE